MTTTRFDSAIARHHSRERLWETCLGWLGFAVLFGALLLLV
jgi:hypothetical protein